jgi:hypothetical protein
VTSAEPRRFALKAVAIEITVQFLSSFKKCKTLNTELINIAPEIKYAASFKMIPCVFAHLATKAETFLVDQFFLMFSLSPGVSFR